MQSFQELGLPAFLEGSLKRMNFSVPTPVQAQAIPPALEGRDIIASAQTGTGKTAGFGIPLLAYLDRNPDRTALVMTPTRELAMQVLGVLRELSGAHDVGGSVLLIGGGNMGSQLAGLARNPRLIIGTPGRIIDHLNQKSLKLDRTGFLVLDEADRMLDMGFEPQLEQIRKQLTAPRQTLLFSATMPPDIESMGSRYLREPVRVSIGTSSQPIPKIEQRILHTLEANKPEELMGQLKERQGSILVFVRTQHRVDRVMRRLKDQGLKVTRIHGGRTQSQRRQAIEQFREGKFDILVATDIAARGLDIHHIAHVINYDLPRNPEDYIHRVGRTARAGAEGSALCFITPEDRDLWNRILRLMKLPADSIKTLPSKFGDFTPQPSPTPAQGAPKPHPRQGSHPPHHRPSHHRGQGDRPHGTGRPDPHGNRERRPHPNDRRHPSSRPQGQHPGHRRPDHRHPDRPHQGHGDRDDRGNRFIFHEKGHRQPTHGEGDHGRKPDNFLSRLGNKFFGGDRRGDGNRGDSRDHRRPHGRPDHRTGEGRTEHRSGGFNRHPQGEQHRRPEHRRDPQGRPSDHPGQRPHPPGHRPGGNFKKRRFPPRHGQH